MDTKRFLAVIGLMAVVGAVSFFAYMPMQFEKGGAVRASVIPLVIGEWQGKDLEMDPRVYAILETDNLIMRDYTNARGEVINVYVIYSQNNRKVAHPPEICLQGGGAMIIDKNEEQLTPDIKATRLVMEYKNLNRDIGYYWYKSGKEYSNNYVAFQFKMSVERLLRKPTSAAMIRLLTPVKDKENPQASLDMLKAFAAQLQPLIEKLP